MNQSTTVSIPVLTLVAGVMLVATARPVRAQLIPYPIAISDQRSATPAVPQHQPDASARAQPREDGPHALAAQSDQEDQELMFPSAERVKNTNSISNQRGDWDEGGVPGATAVSAVPAALGAAAPLLGPAPNGGGPGSDGFDGGGAPGEPPSKGETPHPTPEPGALILAALGLPLLLLLRRGKKPDASARVSFES